MKLKKKDIPLILFVIWLCNLILDQTEFTYLYSVNVMSWVIRTIYISYIISYCNKVYNFHIRYFIYAILIMGVVILIRIQQRNLLYYDMFVFLLLLRNVNYKRILRISAITQIVLVAFVVLSSLGGIIPNMRVYNAGRYRFNIGFAYCTLSANFLFFGTVNYFASKPKDQRAKLAEIVVFFIINYIIFIYTDTKASFWGSVLFLIFVCFFRKDAMNNKFMVLKKVIACGVIPSFAILSIIVGIVFTPSNPFYTQINLLASGRLDAARMVINDYGFTLFGYSIDRSKMTLYSDSSFLNLLAITGMVGLIASCLAFIRIGSFAVANRDKWLVAGLIFVAIHCFTEPQLMDLRYNIILVCLFMKVNANDDILFSKRKRMCSRLAIS